MNDVTWETALVIRGRVVPVEFIERDRRVAGSSFRVPGLTPWLGVDSVDDGMRTLNRWFRQHQTVLERFLHWYPEA